MSDFASLLTSFQKSAATAAASPPEKPHSPRKRPPPATSAPVPSLYPTLKRRQPSFHLSFLIIGGQKCGTTWLHKLLLQCRHLSLPKQKEVHFWDWNHSKGMEWYLRQWDRRPSHSMPLYGEITPDYVVLPPSIIAEIHARFPRLKLVFVARDLVERAWSAMVMELRDRTMGLNPGEFARGIVDDAPQYQRTSVAMQRRRLLESSLPSSQPDSYFIERLEHSTHDSRSDYAGGLKNWYRYFSEEAILIVDYREISSDPRGVLYRIVRHVGVEEGEARRFVDGLEEGEVRRRVNASTSGEGRRKESSESLLERPLLKKRMERYLSKYAADFNALLKEKGYSWELDEYKENMTVSKHK